MTDAFTVASPTYQAARLTAVRDRRSPVVLPRQLTGHLPDPRSAPFVVPRRAGFALVTALQFFVCAGVVTLFWIALS